MELGQQPVWVLDRGRFVGGWKQIIGRSIWRCLWWFGALPFDQRRSQVDERQRPWRRLGSRCCFGRWRESGGGVKRRSFWPRSDLHLANHSDSIVEPHAFGQQPRHFLDRSLDGFHVATELRFEHDQLDGRADAPGLESDEPPESSDCVTDQRQHLLSAQALLIRICFSRGGGERPGRRGTKSAGRPRWRRPRILLLYQP